MIWHLVDVAGLRVVTATPTRAQAVALAHRLVAQVEPSKIEVNISGLNPGVLPGGLYGGRRTAKVAPSSVRSAPYEAARCPPRRTST